MVAKARPVEERFWKYAQPCPNTGCWLWAGYTTKTGYGILWDGRRLVRAHVWAYRRYVGPLPHGKESDHRCRVRSCVNPDHIEPVTHQENCRRRSAVKTHCPQGHPYSGDNLKVYRGMRYCRACSKAWSHAHPRRPRP